MLFLAGNNGCSNGRTTADQHKDNQQSRVACVAGLRNGALRRGCRSGSRRGRCGRCRRGLASVLVFGLLPRHFERGIYPPPGVYLLPLVLVWWENQQEINTPQYKPIHTRTSRNSKPQQAIYSPTYRKALYLLYFLATVRARTAPNTPKRKNTIDNLKKAIDKPYQHRYNN